VSNYLLVNAILQMMIQQNTYRLPASSNGEIYCTLVQTILSSAIKIIPSFLILTSGAKALRKYICLDNFCLTAYILTMLALW